MHELYCILDENELSCEVCWNVHGFHCDVGITDPHFNTVILLSQNSRTLTRKLHLPQICKKELICKVRPSDHYTKRNMVYRIIFLHTEMVARVYIGGLYTD